MRAANQRLDDDGVHDDGLCFQHSIDPRPGEMGFIPQIGQRIARRVDVTLRQEKPDTHARIAVIVDRVGIGLLRLQEGGKPGKGTSPTS